MEQNDIQEIIDKWDNLDEIDSAIMTELITTDGKIPNAQIGRKLGLHANTVRNRRKKVKFKVALNRIMAKEVEDVLEERKKLRGRATEVLLSSLKSKNKELALKAAIELHRDVAADKQEHVFPDGIHPTNLSPEEQERIDKELFGEGKK